MLKEDSCILDKKLKHHNKLNARFFLKLEHYIIGFEYLKKNFTSQTIF